MPLIIISKVLNQLKKLMMIMQQQPDYMTYHSLIYIQEFIIKVLSIKSNIQPEEKKLKIQIFKLVLQKELGIFTIFKKNTKKLSNIMSKVQHWEEKHSILEVFILFSENMTKQQNFSRIQLLIQTIFIQKLPPLTNQVKIIQLQETMTKQLVM